MDERKRQGSIVNLHDIHLWLHPFVIKKADLEGRNFSFPVYSGLSEDEFVDKLTHLDELLDNPPLPTAFSISFIQKGAALKEIMQLLADLYKGQINNYLQEVINAAETEVVLVNEDPSNPESRKNLEVKIKVAATVIDKYSTLLEIVLGKKSLSSKDKVIVKNAEEILNSTSRRLKRINLMQGIAKLRGELDDYLEEEYPVSCFSVIFNRRPVALMALSQIFEDLVSEPLSEQELVGALYLLKSQQGRINNKKDRNLMMAGLRGILQENRYLEVDKDNACGKAFIARADVVNISWPAPFSVPEVRYAVELNLR